MKLAIPLPASYQDRLRRLLGIPQGALSLERSGALLGLLLLVLVFSLLSPSFRQWDNLAFLVKNAAITIGIVAVGQTVVLISGGIDLSVSSVIAFTGLISAWLMKYGLGPIPPLTGNLCYLAILIGWVAGSLIGAAQGWLITTRQIPPFIVTLATMLGLRGITIGISGAIIYGLPTEFRWVSEGQVFFISMPLLIMLVVYLFTAYMLKRTKVGRYCFAIGGNETAARLAGVDVNRYRIYFYAYSGLLAAVTGTLILSYINAAIYSHGEGYQFNSIAAAIIGGNSLAGGVGGVWGTFIGVLILAIIPSGLIMLNAPFWSRDVVTAMVIIAAVIIDMDRSRSRKKAIMLEASQPGVTGQYLNDLLNKLAQKIERHTGSSLCRIYLVDRDTGDLVPQEVRSCETDNPGQSMALGKSQIAAEARDTGRAVLIQDVMRTGFQRVMPLVPDVQSALAFPLMNADRCIGVIELQSPGVGTLKEAEVETLDALARPMVVGLEDAWLFESGWLVRQVRDALRHLWDDLYLGRLPLAEWVLPEQEIRRERTAGARGDMLRSLLLEKIESLKPQEKQEPGRGPRSYRILRLTYVEEKPVDQMLNMMHISRRQYFYDLKDSIEILTDILVRSHR